MTTTANTTMTSDAWTVFLTSSDGKATIEARGGVIEYAYSTSSISLNQIKGLTLAPSMINVDGAYVINQLRIASPLVSGMSLYGRCLKDGGNASVVIFKDTESFGG